jgi:hypothetical protein
MTTTVQAAVQWTGENLAIGDSDIPHWIIQAMGAAKLTFNEPNMGVETSGGPVSAAATDWLVLLPDNGGLAVVTATDFNANYEIAP